MWAYYARRIQNMEDEGNVISTKADSRIFLVVNVGDNVKRSKGIGM